MQSELIEKAIIVAKENKTTFGFALLKRKLQIGLVTCNLLIDELLELGVIECGDSQQKYKVLL